MLLINMDNRPVQIRTSRSASDLWCRTRLPGQVDDRGRVVCNAVVHLRLPTDLPFQRQVGPWTQRSHHPHQHVQTNSELESCLLRAELSDVELKMNRMAHYMAAIEQENATLKKRLACVRMAVNL